MFGDKALKSISGLQISDQYIQVNHHYPTGTVNVFFDEFKNPDYEIIKNVAYDFVTFNDSLEKLILQSDCICFGTLAQRNNTSRQTLHELLKRFKGKYRFYDLNLRKDCYSDEIIISSLGNTDILKLNKQEAYKINDILCLGKEGLPEISMELIKKFQLQYCVITLEEYGSLAVSFDGEIVYNPGFKVKLADPLGAGDAFSAGFLDALLKGKSLKEASESGNQLGAMVATKKGATAVITKYELSDITLNYDRIADQNYIGYGN
jgi:fructokinase